MEPFIDLAASAGVTAVAVVLLFAVSRLLDRPAARARAGHAFRHQVTMLVLTLLTTIGVLLAIPVSDSTRGNLFSLFGIVLSAAVALSSTTVLGNAMAGLMLGAIRNFRAGDFIRVGEHFGRVSERGLVTTEIQTEHRELTTFSNLYLIQQPITVIRHSGTIVHCTLSLGYDLDRHAITRLLLLAAERAELAEPYVQILALGDHSVTYRVGGLLEEVKQLLSVRSKLRGQVLDTLHEHGVEIVSPVFMNQRPVPPESPVIPPEGGPAPSIEDTSVPEELVFDKADAAESLEQLRDRLERLDKELREVKARPAADETTKAGRDRQLAALERYRELVMAALAAREAGAEDD